MREKTTVILPPLTNGRAILFFGLAEDKDGVKLLETAPALVGDDPFAARLQVTFQNEMF